MRFNHVFFGLMTLSFLGAFVFSQTPGDRARAQVQNIFAPVAWPTNRISNLIANHFFSQTLQDDGSPKHARGSTELIVENQQLRMELASLSSQLNQLQAREAERSKLGNVRSFCTAFSVVGLDGGYGQSLALNATSFDHLQNGMAVLYAGGIAGRISRVGMGGSQVMLVTDPQSALTGVFARFENVADSAPRWQMLTIPPVLVRGGGERKMAAVLETKLAKDGGLQEDDWLVLRDGDWPRLLDGYRVGTVKKIVASHDPGYSDVQIEPESNLKNLQEVMVLTKAQN